MKTLLNLVAILWIFSVNSRQLDVVIRAPSAILINGENGHILYEKNARDHCPPASITKIVVAWYILEKFGNRLDEMAISSKEALLQTSPHIKKTDPSKHPSYRIEPKSSLMNLQVGEKISIRHLLYGLMLVSGNDAGNVLAEHFGGSIEGFVADINRFLQEHGCVHTAFVNPHGLHHIEHKTTAADMAKIASRAMQNKEFAKLVSTVAYECPASNKRSGEVLRQSNKLLMPGKYFYPKAIGVKTGHTSSAGFTLVAAARDQKRLLIAVMLGCKEAEDRYLDAKALFETAFLEKKIVRTLLSQEDETFRIVIDGGKNPLQARMGSSLTLEYYPSEEPNVHAEVEWTVKHFPIARGDIVGEVRAIDEKGVIIQKMPLFAETRVEATFWHKVERFKKAVLRFPLTIPLTVASCVITLISLAILRIYKRGCTEK